MSESYTFHVHEAGNPSVGLADYDEEITVSLRYGGEDPQVVADLLDNIKGIIETNWIEATVTGPIAAERQEDDDA